MDIFAPLLEAHASYFLQAVLNAAHTLELPAALCRRPTRDELAQSLGLRARRLGAMLDVLLAEGLLEASPEGELSMCPPWPAAQELPAQGWGQLALLIREDQPLARAERVDELAAQSSYLDALWCWGEPTARELWRRLPTGARLLDLGAGSGVYAQAFLAAAAERSATLVDTSAALGWARQRLTGFDHRLSFEEAELLEYRPAGRFDVVLLANVLHLYGREQAQALLRVATAACAFDGQLLVVELGRRRGQLPSRLCAYFSLNMAIYTQNGEVHSVEALSDWLLQLRAGEVCELGFESAPRTVALIQSAHGGI